MKKIFVSFCVLIIFLNIFNSYLPIVNASTNVWADEYKVEFGKTIKIHYGFDDGSHYTKISIYYNGKEIDVRYVDAKQSNTMDYKADKEGDYKFVITPLDSSNFTGECVVNVYKHRVILIPGIMASELYDGNEKVWIPDTINPIAATNKIGKLAMNSNGEQIVELSAGLPVPKYYNSLHKFLDVKYHVVDFGYDWRNGASKNASLLKNVIDKEKKKSPSSKIFIVAHSMGGGSSN
ncbi:hypothetical protein J2Z32_002246 [Paenibacillus turicensis]|uniref:Uncharacterized protein n=1 Tax=Paenibacillus turicensis TaxID=160487 RepID=A0ABS4FSQ4_9BACL|nr:hypothetical protein [Paenibacillus turicensis]MBP1905616.1 hypothetical protein [Paenibacillus turicensis]